MSERNEVNRGFCASIGDHSQVTWEKSSQWQRDSAVNGVRLHIGNPDAGPKASHDNWMAEKIADGWVYGEVKDPDKKTHPCIVPFGDLPVEQQSKDFIFRSIVHALSGPANRANCSTK